MTNLNEITYVDWQLKLNAIGGVAEGADDINQCIAIILLTKKGSVPHRPTFGSDIYKYIDYLLEEKENIILNKALIIENGKIKDMRINEYQGRK